MSVGQGRSGGRILGIDPGSRITGYGVIEQGANGLTFVSCGVIKTTPKMGLPQRLKEIHEGIVTVIDNFQPGRAAVEDVFVSVNPRSALMLGQARGVALLAAMQAGMAVSEFSPRMIKQTVVGYGQAQKEQVQQMVRILLGLQACPSTDAADALAVAICCANHSSSPDSLSSIRQPLVNRRT